jgi:hypothetical protein
VIRRFIIYPLSHTILLVDITEIGLPTEIYPPEGTLKTVPTYRFNSWRFAEEFLLKMGADAKVLGKITAQIAKGTIDVLTIV